MAEGDNLEQKIKLTYSTNADSVSAEVGRLDDTITDTTESQKKNDDQVKKSEVGLKSFKAQIKEANQELLKSIQLYGETSQETAIAAQKVADLKDQMGFANDIAAAFNPDQKMKALGAATQIAATGTSAVVSGLALIGDESEETQKMLLKVQAAMAFSDAISGLSDLGDKWDVFKTVVVDSYNKIVAARRADIVATNAQTVAERIKNAVLLMNPYIAIAAAVLAVSIATVAFIKHSNEAAAAQAKLGGELSGNKSKIDGLKASIQDFNDTADDWNETDLLRAKLSGASETKLQQMVRDQKQETVDFARKKDKEAYEAQLEAQDNLRKARKLDNDDQIKEAEDNLEAAKELSKSASKAYGDAITDQTKTNLQQQIDNNNRAEQLAKEQREKDKVAREKRAKEQQEKRDEWVRKEIEMYDKLRAEAADFDKQIEAARKSFEDRQKTEREVKINDENIRYQQQLDKAKELHKSTEYLELEHLNKINDINLEADQKDYEQWKLIEDAKLAFKEQINQAEWDLASKGVEFLSTIAGKNKALQKAAIIADSAIGIGKTIISTVEANAKAVAASPLTVGQPFVGLNTASAAIGIATNIAATAKALSAVGGGSASTGSTSIPTTSGASSDSSSATPQVNFQGSSENQIANSVQSVQSELPPIRTYVVASEMTAQQETDYQAQNDNSLAGDPD